MYYKLTYRSSIKKSQVGDFYLCGKNAMDIGQTNSCVVRLPESTDVESTVFATILPREQEEGWLIVRRTDAQEVKVNGKNLQISQALKDGDLISFVVDGQVTSFVLSIHTDGEYSSAMGIVYQTSKSHGRFLYMMIGIAILAFLVSALAFFQPRDSHILRHADLDAYDSSVYHIEVDSVFLLKDSVINGRLTKVVLEAVALDNQVAGTCFLTDDGLFVTARHCVEPWISDEDWNGVSYDSKMSPAVRLATMAETYNMVSGKNMYSVKSHGIISKKLEQYEFYSTDFHFNKSRDQVVCLGTDRNPIYWRTIMPLANRRDMELGDFAYLESKGLKGMFKLADIHDLKVFDKQADKDIVVVGYPVNDNHDEDICVKVFGNSQHLDFKKGQATIKGCIQMSAPVNPGNSGGPVLARIHDEVKVIGIVSKADAQATQGTFWAVPVTEINDLRQQGGVIKDSLIFRR